MTPVEIEWALAAFAAGERRKMEQLDAAAWMAGRYAAFAWHAPRRFPKRPDCVRRRPVEMTDEEMKRVLVGLAGRKGAVE